MSTSISSPIPSGQLGLSVPFNVLVNNSGGLDAEFAAFAKLGVSWIRTDFWWDVIQQGPTGGYDWTNYDHMVSLANSYGIKVLGLIDGMPSWVSNSGGMANAANQQAYGQFAATVAQHFDGKVSYFEIGNEENLGGPWGAQPSAADYTASLKDAYTGIKAVDPNDLVMSGGLAAVPSTGDGYVGAADFLQQMYADGAAGYFDAVAFHPYTWPYLPGTESWNGWQIMTSDIRSDMVAHGDGGKQIWVTEVGAPTGGPNSDSEQTQATNLQDIENLAQANPAVGPVIWHSYQDLGGDPGNTEDWYGLLRPDGSQKPAYATYQNITAKFPTTPAASSPSAGASTPAGGSTSTTSPAPVNTTIGSGADALVLKISQDAYLGSAQYTVSVDGTQIGGTLTASALHGSGQDDTITVNGTWAPGNHTVVVNFLNDAWGGTPSTDRNLYVDGISYDGASVPNGTATLGGNGPVSFGFTDVAAASGPAPVTTTIGSGSDALVLKISQDAYLGSAQYTVSVDGTQIGGTLTASALHSSGQDDTVTVNGNWAGGSHTVSVNFLNDAWGGTSSTDRNLYVDGATYNGSAVSNSTLELGTTGPSSFSFVDPSAAKSITVGSGSKALVLQVSEDAYLGEAQYTVQVDGKQIGGTLSATSSHAMGQEDVLTVLGNWGSGTHTATINFLNDAWGGTSSTDRNLYIDSGTYGGVNDPNAHLALYGAGPQSFAFS